MTTPTPTTATPDVLAALELLVADVAGYPAWERPCYALDVARAAIAGAHATRSPMSAQGGGEEGWRGVDPQVEVAAREMDAVQKGQPEWLWYENGGKCLSFGRWAADPVQAPYIRADIALARPAPEVKDAQGAVRPSKIIEWLETEVSAIDCMYRGDPSYEHDAYWMKDRVFRLLKDAAKAFPDCPTEVKDAPAVTDAMLFAAMKAYYGDGYDGRLLGCAVEIDQEAHADMRKALVAALEAQRTTPAPAASDELVERARSRINWLSGHLVKGSVPRDDAKNGAEAEQNLLRELLARIKADAAEMERKDALLALIDLACPRIKGMSIVDAIKAEREDALRLHREKMDALDRATAAEAERDALREALVDHNDLLRSAFQASQRDAIHEVRGTTNYRLLANRANEVLIKHHAITNAARAALRPEAKGGRE